MVRVAQRAVVLCAIIALSLVTVATAETTRGTWSLMKNNGAFELQMSWRDSTGAHANEHTSDVDPQRLGIAQTLAGTGERTRFTMHREAGDYAFEGWIGNGEGSGQYTFTPNDAFFATLNKRGYTVDGMNYKMAFANLDITMSYIDSMERLGYKGDTSHLIAMKALGVTPEYVAQMKSAGVDDLTETHVISMKAMHVDKAYIDEMASAGFPHLEANQYVTLKAMHVDAAYIKYLHDHGFKNLTVNQVVSMKAERI